MMRSRSFLRRRVLRGVEVWVFVVWVPAMWWRGLVAWWLDGFILLLGAVSSPRVDGVSDSWVAGHAEDELGSA